MSVLFPEIQSEAERCVSGRLAIEFKASVVLQEYIKHPPQYLPFLLTPSLDLAFPKQQKTPLMEGSACLKALKVNAMCVCCSSENVNGWSACLCLLLFFLKPYTGSL
jgi:hypothetical protein